LPRFQLPDSSGFGKSQFLSETPQYSVIMKRKSAWLSFTACALTAASVPASVRAADRTAAQPKLPDVQVVSYANGHTGFYEKKTGTLYIYDSSRGQCVGVRKINRLGEAMQTLAE